MSAKKVKLKIWYKTNLNLTLKKFLVVVSQSKNSPPQEGIKVEIWTVQGYLISDPISLIFNRAWLALRDCKIIIFNFSGQNLFFYFKRKVFSKTCSRRYTVLPLKGARPHIATKDPDQSFYYGRFSSIFSA